MACPHVSGVVALGLSYAARLHKHFRASDIKDMLYESAKPFENYWSLMSGYPSKNYYKYVADQQRVHYTSMNLDNLKGKMGHGLVDAAAFLRAIENGGVQMQFPNVLLSVGEEKYYDLSLYMDASGCQVDIEDGSVASASYDKGKVCIKGLKAGQSEATVTSGQETHRFVITVRASAGSIGWL